MSAYHGAKGGCIYGTKVRHFFRATRNGGGGRCSTIATQTAGLLFGLYVKLWQPNCICLAKINKPPARIPGLVPLGEYSPAVLLLRLAPRHHSRAIPLVQAPAVHQHILSRSSTAPLVRAYRPPARTDDDDCIYVDPISITLLLSTTQNRRRPALSKARLPSFPTTNSLVCQT